MGWASWTELCRLGAYARHAGVAAFEVADDRHERGGRPFGLAPEPRQEGVDRLVIGLHHAEAVARRLLGRGLARPGDQAVEISGDATVGQLVVEHVVGARVARAQL